MCSIMESRWIKYGSVGFFEKIAKTVSLPRIHCHVAVFPYFCPRIFMNLHKSCFVKSRYSPKHQCCSSKRARIYSAKITILSNTSEAKKMAKVVSITWTGWTLRWIFGWSSVWETLINYIILEIGQTMFQMVSEELLYSLSLSLQQHFLVVWGGGGREGGRELVSRHHLQNSKDKKKNTLIGLRGIKKNCLKAKLNGEGTTSMLRIEDHNIP